MKYHVKSSSKRLAMCTERVVLPCGKPEVDVTGKTRSPRMCIFTRYDNLWFPAPLCECIGSVVLYVLIYIFNNSYKRPPLRISKRPGAVITANTVCMYINISFPDSHILEMDFLF